MTPSLSLVGIMQQLSCICKKGHCTNSLNAQGGFKFVQLCTQSRDEGSLVRPLFDDKFSCTCDIYHYQCSVLYYIHDFAKLAAQAQTAREKRGNLVSQTNINTFLGIKSSIVDMAQDMMKKRSLLL